ncbi:MAG: DHA2 family efflux MFS transporter permease subunit [Candidatus Limnocylindrales bacterium]|jgi:EmrB/QacA subfamily drug resistance transporter
MATAGSRRWWALGAITLALLAVTLDVTVLTVALPTLAGTLKASESQLQWFVTAYTLALVAGMLPAGLLGDRYGRKAVMVAALVLFAAGSAGCAYAPGPEVFIAARVVLGLAGAAMIVMALSVITVMFDEAERPRAVGIWGAANFVGLPLGPIIGGWMLTNVWWGWIFLMNVPVALLGLVAVVALVPESRSAQRPSIDFGGVILSSAGLVALMYGVVQAGDNGWGSSSAIVPAVIGLLVLVGFVLWERRLTGRPGGQPLIDLSLFRSRSFTWGMVLTAFGIFGLFGVLFALPQYFQAILGLDPQGSGVRLLPVIAGLIVGAVPADRVAARLGAKFTVAAGFAVVIAGLLLGATMTATSGDGLIAAWTFVAGAGAGLGFATSASAALVELSADRSGVGSALLQAVIKLGPAFGASILGSVLNSTYQGQVSLAGLSAQAAASVKGSVFSGLAVAKQLNSLELLASVRNAFVAGIDDAVRVAAVVAAAGVILALAFMPGRVHATDTAETSQAQPGGVTVSQDEW